MAARAGRCWAGPEAAAYHLHGAETRAMPALSCQVHAGDSVAALLAAGASLVLVSPLDSRREAGKGRQRAYPEAAEVLEQVRRAGAHSADPGDLARMERDLWAAVLAAIADGAPGAAELAATALMTLRYGHDRRQQ
jgi:hypothetical protein